MITPMVAKLVKEPFDREGWFFELKWDGFRAIAETESNGSVRLYSRREVFDLHRCFDYASNTTDKTHG